MVSIKCDGCEVSKKNGVLVTDKEARIIGILHEQVSELFGKGVLKKKVQPQSIVKVCSVVSMTKYHKEFPPQEAALVLKGLLGKGLVVEMEDNGMPSFVPVSVYDKYLKKKSNG